MDRRTFLALSATGAVAGCLDGDEGGVGGDGDEVHPAARDIDTQPRHGPDPTEATGLIVAFEDPSCHRCRDFERDVVPQIREELVAPGDAAYVFRGYPAVYDWGEPAVRALEAVHARDPAAHWTLVDHYFENQADYRAAGPDAVYERTESFLDSATDLDAAAVLEAAAAGEHDPAVETDRSAAQDAGASGRTPFIVLFRDGEYRTEAAGIVGFDVIRNALQL